MPNVPEIEELLKSGAHFGHLTRRWNPKMKNYIFMERNGIHIIDLKKTQTYFEKALEEVEKLSRAGKTILFVGTKKQSQEIIKTEAVRCGMPYVTFRWMGGMLTNFTTIRKSISRMEDIEKMRTDGTYDELTKKETLMLDREQEKLKDTLGGIANMSHIPDAVFIVDTLKENIAVNEAVKLHLPIIAMADTNSDPDIPDYIIPCNDDSARTIQLVAGKIADAIVEGNAQRETQKDGGLRGDDSDSQQDNGDSQVTVKTKATGKRRKRRRRKKDDSASNEEE